MPEGDLPGLPAKMQPMKERRVAAYHVIAGLPLRKETSGLMVIGEKMSVLPARNQRINLQPQRGLRFLKKGQLAS